MVYMDVLSALLARHLRCGLRVALQLWRHKGNRRQGTDDTRGEKQEVGEALAYRVYRDEMTAAKKAQRPLAPP